MVSIDPKWIESWKSGVGNPLDSVPCGGGGGGGCFRRQWPMVVADSGPVVEPLRVNAWIENAVAVAVAVVVVVVVATGIEDR